MLLSPRKNGLTSLFKEVRVFKALLTPQCHLRGCRGWFGPPKPCRAPGGGAATLASVALHFDTKLSPNMSRPPPNSHQEPGSHFFFHLACSPENATMLPQLIAFLILRNTTGKGHVILLCPLSRNICEFFVEFAWGLCEKQSEIFDPILSSPLVSLMT